MATKPAATDDDDEYDCSAYFSTMPIFREEEEEDRKEEEVQEPVQQQEEEELYHPHHLKSINATIVIRQIRSRGLSFQLWPAASTLVSLIETNPSLLHLPPLPTTRLSSPLRILEIGSGTGLLGIAAAAILGAHVTITDIPEVLYNLQFNADANKTVVGGRGGEVAVRQLTWGCEEDWMAGAVGGGGEFDVVLGSDVVYHEELIEPLVKTARFFVKGKVGFVMAYMRRWKKRESVLFNMVRKLFDVQVLHQDPPLEGHRTGVIVYRFVEKAKAM